MRRALARSVPKVVRLVYEHAQLVERVRAGMPLAEPEWSHLDSYQVLLRDEVDPLRSHRRFNLDQPGALCCGRFEITTKVRNVSAGGCEVDSPMVLQPGTKLRLAVPSEHEGHFYVFPGQVLRCEMLAPGKMRLGISFCGTPMHLKRPMSGMISKSPLAPPLKRAPSRISRSRAMRGKVDFSPTRSLRGGQNSCH